MARILKIEQVNKFVCYLLYSPNKKGYNYKIGITKNLNNRLRTLKTATPDIIVIKQWGHTQLIQVKQYERVLHGEFMEQRQANSEWFDLTDEQVAMLCKPNTIDEQNLLIDTMKNYRRKFYCKGLTNPLELCYN